MRDINTGFGSRKDTRTVSRGISDTELRRMIPGYIPGDFNKSKTSTESTDQENPQANRSMQSWKKLQVPYKSNNGDSILSKSGSDMPKGVSIQYFRLKGRSDLHQGARGLP